MNDGIIRVCIANPTIALANPLENAKLFADLCRRAAAESAKIILFPELSLTGATAGELYLHRPLISSAEKSILSFARDTASLDIVSVVGAPLLIEGSLYNTAVIIHKGEILGIVPKSRLSSGEKLFSNAPDIDVDVIFDGKVVPFGKNLVFFSQSIKELSISCGIGERAEPISANINLILSALPETVGAEEYIESAVRAMSVNHCSCVVYSGAGAGESGTDYVFAGRGMAYQCGKLMAKNCAFSAEELTFFECDLEICSHEKIANDIRIEPEYAIELTLESVATEIKLPLAKNPFVPENQSELAERCDKIYELQARGLAKRIERSYSKTAVIGISGGLDSTLALLVCAKAMDILGRARSSIITVTMPCFGTTPRTKGNAQLLSEALGTSFRTVDIKNAVLSHFADIGHNPENMNVVYENAQARERTQVLMDIANAEGGLVVGTGDLSELALGFATYNGDHMSMFGVNGSVPKTLMRAIVTHIANTCGNESVKNVLLDIVNTPVSPELLPADANGEIAQCTEVIVGPYELHDYFLYYTVRYGFSPKKILRLAEASFRGVYDRATIKAWLKIFVKRFFSQQFKRSCLPDGVKVGSVSLSPRGDFSMPSDVSSALWIAEFDEE